MPIISKIGARSRKIRTVYAAIYAALIIGAVTIAYPLLLMFSGSFKSETDFIYVTPYPRFWTDETILFQKYVESKYNLQIPDAEAAWQRQLGSWRRIDPGEQDGVLLDAFLTWRRQFDMPPGWYALGHSHTGPSRPARFLTINARLFRKQMYEKFNGDLAAFVSAMNLPARSWNVVVAPPEVLYSRRQPEARDLMRAWQRFKVTRPVHDRIIANLDGAFWRLYLMPTYTDDIEEYNRRHNTRYARYPQVLLTRRVPAGGLVRQDWEKFVREELNLHFIRLDSSLAPSYRRFLAEQYGRIETLNQRYRAKYASFQHVPFPSNSTDDLNVQSDLSNFIKDRAACPAEGIEVYGPRAAFEEFVARQRGVPLAQITPLELPLSAIDHHDAMAHKSQLRWELTTRNYKQVFGFLLQHGRGIVNTLIYCALAIGTALLVNPLAAYALSRYKPPSTYKVLLFCMATMAFPAEVTMIPSFLLLKRFPLWTLVGAAAGFVVLTYLLAKFAPRRSEVVRMSTALGCAILIGAWLVPSVLLPAGRHNVSLLNTFAALVLPGMANGYFIFLLKGFFDSLPRDLYEAADIDGAGEWTKFWTITMSLSKPILAVIALGAFTAAYSAFMMALIVIPDRDMWTLMVWIFQLQSQSHQAVVYASLLIAAVPTFGVFVICQRVIIRGIIVPVEK